MNGILSTNIFLRDQFINIWCIGVTKSEKDIYIEHGWEKFIKENIIELGDFFIVYYDWTRIFEFKLLIRTWCVKKTNWSYKNYSEGGGSSGNEYWTSKECGAKGEY